MNSFVKPSARIKFGLAIASSTTLAASPFMGLPAFAATITVDTCTQFGSGAQVGLGDAINAANAAAGADIIDMTSLSSCTISISSSMEIAESLTINGGDGVTLQLAARAHIFTMASGVGIDLAVNDLVMDGFDDEWYAGFNLAPTVASTVTLTGVTMRDFDLTALYARNINTSLTVVDSTFDGNRAPGGSGAIRASAPVTVINSTFTNNTSTNGTGGAIRVDDSSLTISGSTFTGNDANRGGAIGVMYDDSSLTITDDAPSTFSGNSSDFWGGGAIYVYDGSVTFEGETAVSHSFSGNTTPTQGGAISIVNYTQSSDIQIDADVTFSLNTAKYGGGLSVVNMFDGLGTVDITGNVVANANEALDGGGAVYFAARDMDPSNPALPGLDVTFSGSVVDLHHNAADIRGGAIYARSRAGNIYVEMTADQVSMTYNEAVHGGAVALTSYNSVDDATADYENSFSITEGVADISFNRATRYGGAIYSKGFDVDLIGGGEASVYDALGASEAVAMHEFASNRADLDGGFIFAKGNSDITLQLASLHDNTALSSALMRGIYSDFSVAGNSIVDNGHIPGSVVFNITYGRLEAYANLFAGNRALGTMLRTRANDTILAGNTFIDNRSGDSTIFSNGSSELGLVVQHNTFINNVSVGSSYSAITDGTYPTGDPTLETISGNIFYSLQANDQQVYLNYSSKLGPGNLFNAVATGTYSLAPLLMPFSPLLGDTYSMLVTAEQLNLTWLDTWSNEGNLGLNLKTVSLGEGSVAIDLMKSAPNSALSSFGYDGRFENLFMDGTRDPGHGTGFDVGAFEAFNPNRPQDNDDQPPATEPNVLITSISKGEISAGGDSFKVYGRGLDGVSALYVGDVRVGFDVVSSTELAVTTGNLPVGRFAITAVADDGRAVYQDGIVVVAGADATSDPKFWTKRMSDGTAKMYASNIVGQGKVQFFVNGKEVAWVRAVDGNDPKLRQANGSSYLVRTVELSESGKTRLEVKVNGKRVRFTTYVN